MTQQIVRVTEDTTKAELAETLALLNGEAMRISRRGEVGIRSKAYTIQHERINAVFEDWERAKA